VPVVDAPLSLFFGLLDVVPGLAVPGLARDDAAVLPDSVVQVLAARVGHVHVGEAHRDHTLRVLFLFKINTFSHNSTNFKS
jgi:hypothetical protein